MQILNQIKQIKDQSLIKNKEDIYKQINEFKSKPIIDLNLNSQKEIRN